MTDVRDRLWTQEPGVLFQSGRILEFWPHRMHSREEKVNAIVRFSVFAALLLYVVSRKPKYLVMGAAAALGVTVLHPWLRAARGVPCVQPRSMRRPTPNNPFGNRLVSDESPDERPFDHDAEAERDAHFQKGLYMNFEDAWNKHSSERQFRTMPEGDQGAFAKFLYGDHKGKDMENLMKKTSGMQE